jgi:tetratricopeptide (TPR) repeat protein
MEEERMVSATLAEIYLEQGHFDMAIEIYGKLSKKDPDNDYYKKRLAVIRREMKDRKKPGGLKNLLKKKIW